ncbi:hypothetical protein P4K82_26075 [Bacillus cereus]|nr:hypothetical protein [Bacillus cereus]
MWKKINNYKFHLKDLKFMTWLFPIVGLLYAYESYNGFTTGRTYYWINGIGAVIFLLFFILNMRDFTKKNYRTS